MCVCVCIQAGLFAGVHLVRRTPGRLPMPPRSTIGVGCPSSCAAEMANDRISTLYIYIYMDMDIYIYIYIYIHVYIYIYIYIYKYQYIYVYIYVSIYIHIQAGSLAGADRVRRTPGRLPMPPRSTIGVGCPSSCPAEMANDRISTLYISIYMDMDIYIYIYTHIYIYIYQYI